jgi:S1-C subfamily serine protease
MTRHARARVLCFLLLAMPAPGHAADAWERIIERVSEGVVALRVTGTRPFDTEGAGVAVATGFVVDAEHGLILTNRHVVRPGPVTAEAVFLNHERVPVWPVYRDPVHDYGFFRYDPGQVRFMKPRELRLAPEAARVGSEVRVIGNDAGEKLSILAGTLARLDRDSPHYGRGSYGDFNTFYYQAASGTSGGSSGSPVVDREGRVVALVAGGSRRAASSFFLPLDRVVYALERLRAGMPVARGTLQAVFERAPYDELGRLGLSQETEARMRRQHAGAPGLLVAREVLPGGPSAGRLEPGDVLLSFDGEPVLDFATLAAGLDASVGQSVRLAVERGGEALTLELPVQDLRAVTPAAYLEFSGGVLHDLSFQLGRSYGIRVSGVFLAGRGYAFARAGIPSRAVIRALGAFPTPDLAAFEAALARLPEGARVPVRWVDLARPELVQSALLRVDRRWFPVRHCTRDDAAGRFSCRALEAPPREVARVSETIRIPGGGPGPSERLARSFVLVNFDVPYAIDGVHGTSFTGAGLIVDAERGRVLVDRDTVPVTLGDVELVFGGSLAVDGRVVALHPEHNLALVAYEPEQLGETPVESAVLSGDPLEVGDDVWLVTLTKRHERLAREARVERLDTRALPLPSRPRFRESNLELVRLTENLPGAGGVVADGRGRVRAIWASFSTRSGRQTTSFFAGIPAEIVRDWLGEEPRDERPGWRSLGVELGVLSLAAAREHGLGIELAAELADHAPSDRRVLVAKRIFAGSPAAEVLRVGDLIIRAGGATVTRFREVERASQADVVRVLVSRDGEAREVDVQTLALDGDGADEALLWAGALLQEPPLTLASQWGAPRQGVYVGTAFRGTPAERHRLRPTRRVLAVEGNPTPDLEAFRAAVAPIGDRESLRLRVADLEGKIEVLSLELDLHSWPTTRLQRVGEGWERTELPPPTPR